MQVQELAPGLWRWTARHPKWTPSSEGWSPEVGCYYVETPSAVVLIDPLVPADEEERFFAALDRDVERAANPVHVLLTTPDHERSADVLRERYAARDDLPAGVEAVETPDERLFWLPQPRALVVGDVFQTEEGTLRLWPEPTPDLMRSLEPLRTLPVEMVLVTHGEPVLTNAGAALAAALHSAPSAA
jgi:glyoxylase-like metal-dependent hydrolase (beta-lactamase superfamily II)